MRKSISLLSLALFLILFQCKKKADTETSSASEIPSILFMYRGDVEIFSAEKNPIPLEAKKTELLSGYTIHTKDKSSVDILLYDGSIVRVFPNTRIRMGTFLDSIDNRSTSKILMTSGKVFVKSNKLPKTRNIIVETTTTVAGVRGTEFIVEQDLPPMPDAPPPPGKVLVAEGSVEAGGLEEETRLIIEEGKKLEFEEDSFVVQDMTPEEKMEIEKESQSVASLVDSGRAEIQSIVDRFKDEKGRIIQEMDKKKEENRELIDEQKRKDNELLRNQKEKDRNSMDSIKSSTDTKKSEVKDKTQEDLDRMKSGTQSEMDRIRGGMKQ